MKLTDSSDGVMQNHRSVRERVFDGREARQLAVPDFYRRNGRLSTVRVLGGYDRHWLADEADPIQGKNWAITETVAIEWIDVFEISAGEYGTHAWQDLGFASVNGLDHCVGEGAVKNFCFEQVRKGKIAGKLRLPGYLFDPVNSKGISSDCHERIACY